jgi:hypothetical protein
MGDDDVLRSGELRLPGFAPHGEISLRHDDGLLRWELEGPFNAEAIQRFALLRQAGFERWQLAGRWLAAVVQWRVSALMAPEAFDTYRDGLRDFIRSQRRIAAVAWVAEAELEGLGFMRDLFERLYRQEGVAFAVFEDSLAAERWAREQLESRRAEDQPAASLSRSMSMNCQKSTQNS